jgi:hypothetical protein
MLSEYALIKLCLSTPTTLDLTFNQLNLTHVKDPKADELGQDGSRERRAAYLFHSVWSAVTKCLRNIVQSRQQALEIPNFAIFGPVLDKFAKLPNPMDKGEPKPDLTLGKPVFVVINDDFLNSMDWKVAVDTASVRAVGRFNKF